MQYALVYPLAEQHLSPIQEFPHYNSFLSRGLIQEVPTAMRLFPNSSSTSHPSFLISDIGTTSRPLPYASNYNRSTNKFVIAPSLNRNIERSYDTEEETPICGIRESFHTGIRSTEALYETLITPTPIDPLPNTNQHFHLVDTFSVVLPKSHRTR